MDNLSVAHAVVLQRTLSKQNSVLNPFRLRTGTYSPSGYTQFVATRITLYMNSVVQIYPTKSKIYQLIYYVIAYIYIYIYWGKAMANYPQELAQVAVCQSYTGHMTGLWFLTTRPPRLNTNEWMNEYIVVQMTQRQMSAVRWMWVSRMGYERNQ